MPTQNIPQPDVDAVSAPPIHHMQPGSAAVAAVDSQAAQDFNRREDARVEQAALAPLPPGQHPLKKALHATLAAATVMFGTSPPALVRRAGYIADHAVTYYDPYGTDLTERIEDLASRMKQWGPEEWSQVPPEKAQDLAARLGKVDATASLASLFRAHAETAAPSRTPRLTG